MARPRVPAAGCRGAVGARSRRYGAVRYGTVAAGALLVGEGAGRQPLFLEVTRKLPATAKAGGGAAPPCRDPPPEREPPAVLPAEGRAAPPAGSRLPLSRAGGPRTAFSLGGAAQRRPPAGRAAALRGSRPERPRVAPRAGVLNAAAGWEEKRGAPARRQPAAPGGGGRSAGAAWPPAGSSPRRSPSIAGEPQRP